MIKILNANNILGIIDFLKKDKRIFFSKKLGSLLIEDSIQLRNMIFNQYIIPIAEINDVGILNLALFDFRYCNVNSEFVVLMCGNIEKEFLDKCYKKLLENDYSIKKITVKFLFSDINENIIKSFEKAGFENELDVKIGVNTFYQFSLFYDQIERR